MRKKVRILVVDDDRSMVRTLVDIIKVKGYEAEPAYSGIEAREKVKADKFDCVLTDIKMTGMNGLELYRYIKDTRPDLPVVLMTAYYTDKLLQKALDEGAIASLSKPLDIDLLVSFISALGEGQSVVIIDDNAAFRKSLGDTLKAQEYEVIEVIDLHDVAEKVSGDGQVVLLDMKLNGKNGRDVMKQIRKKHPHLPVILITGYREEMSQEIESVLKAKAYTCLYKPFEIDELLQILIEIRNQELRRIFN